MLISGNRKYAASSTIAIVLANGLVVADVENGSLRLHESPSAEMFGFGVWPLGDVNADGTRDYAISAPAGPLGDEGRVIVYSGASGEVLLDIAEPGGLQFFGFSVTGIGDVNGDGRADLAIGAPLGPDFPGPGHVRAISGADGSTIWQKIGTSTAQGFGWATCRIDDLNLDGIADLAISWPGSGGGVTLASGADGLTLALWQAPAGSTGFGSTVCSVDDLDGDDRRDVLVGGRDRVVILSINGLYAIDQIIGPSQSEFGGALAGINDIDGDGVGDFAIGAKTFKVDSVSRGAVFAYSGATRTLIWQTVGERNSALGTCVAAGPDANLDGVLDVSIGAPGFRIDDVAVGRAVTVDGLTGEIIRAVNGSPPKRRFGTSIAMVEDVDDDDVHDVLVGREGNETTDGAGYVLRGMPYAPGAMRVESRQAPPLDPQATQLHDFSGDGDLDLLALDAAGRRVGVALNNGLDDFPAVLWRSVPGVPVDASFIDLEGDSGREVIVLMRDRPAFTVYRNTLGVLMPTLNVDVPRKPSAMVVADFDGDGRSDVAVAHRADRRISFYRQKLITSNPDRWRLIHVTTRDVEHEPSRLFAARVNLGRIDVVMFSEADQVVSTLVNKGGFDFAQERTTAAGLSSGRVVDLVVADFDGDGWSDLACASENSSAILIQRSLGNGRFGQPRLIETGAASIHAITAVRLDWRAPTDLAAIDQNGTTWALWMNDWPEAPNVYAFPDTPVGSAILSGDIEGDGDRDIVLAQGEGSLTVLRSLLTDP